MSVTSRSILTAVSMLNSPKYALFCLDFEESGASLSDSQLIAMVDGMYAGM